MVKVKLEQTFLKKKKKWIVIIIIDFANEWQDFPYQYHGEQG